MMEQARLLLNQLKMQGEAGFTLLETIMSLTIISILFTISMPLMMKQLKAYETKQFITVLESDILYAQNNALGKSGSGRTRVEFNEQDYTITENAYRLVQRAYPNQLKINAGIRRVTYNNAGNIIDPKSIDVIHDNKRYQLTFPFGKGRFYVNE